MLIATALILAAAPTILGGWYLAPMLERALAVSRLRSSCARHGVLVLTYDDGPGEALTPRILDLLAERNAKATFFAAGVRAAEHPTVVERIVAEGHELACHAAHHRNAWKCSPRRAVEDIHEGYDMLAPWIDRAALFRPPYGKLTILTRAALALRGAGIGWWTIVAGDVNDELPSPRTAAEHAAREGGGVVLFHDFDRGAQRADFVLQSTRHLLDLANEREWRIATLGAHLERETEHAA